MEVLEAVVEVVEAVVVEVEVEEVEEEVSQEAGQAPSLPARCSPSCEVAVLHQLCPVSTVVQLR